MKATFRSLANRGYLKEGVEESYRNLSLEDKFELLRSEIPVKRTLGARLLMTETGFEVVEELVNALKIEKKLYPKIAICNVLANKEEAIFLLLGELGRIGSNQYTSIPEKAFEKNNYPLPHDIAARTLMRMGKIALPELLKMLTTNNEKQLREAIDVIGYICFYNYQDGIFEQLKMCYQKYTDDLIRWKIVRAMSAFPESRQFLMEQLGTLTNEKIQREIDRSLRLIEKRSKK